MAGASVNYRLGPTVRVGPFVSSSPFVINQIYSPAGSSVCFRNGRRGRLLNGYSKIADAASVRLRRSMWLLPRPQLCDWCMRMSVIGIEAAAAAEDEMVMEKHPSPMGILLAGGVAPVSAAQQGSLKCFDNRSRCFASSFPSPKHRYVTDQL